MEYRRLGNTGLMVSEVCLGCMTFGREADEQLSQRIIHRFPEDIYPYRFIQRFQRV